MGIGRQQEDLDVGILGRGLAHLLEHGGALGIVAGFESGVGPLDLISRAVP